MYVPRSSVNLASPGTIGGTIPGAGFFTTLVQRNGGTPQAFQIYNNYTSGTSYAYCTIDTGVNSGYVTLDILSAGAGSGQLGSGFIFAKAVQIDEGLTLNSGSLVIPSSGSGDPFIITVNDAGVVTGAAL